MAENSEAKALDALAQALANKVQRGGARKPRLRVIPRPRPTIFDNITREAIIRRICQLRRSYALDLIFDQGVFNTAGLATLEDDALIAMLQKMERARECIAEGVAFDEAGLVENMHEHLPAIDLEAP